MSEWKIKGVVDSEETKSAQEQEQAVLDKAVEKGDIAPEAAGQGADDVPKINLDELNKTEDAVQERKTEEVSVENETGNSEEVVEEVREQSETEEAKDENSPLELITEEEVKEVKAKKPKVDENAARVNEQPQQPQVPLRMVDALPPDLTRQRGRGQENECTAMGSTLKRTPALPFPY